MIKLIIIILSITFCNICYLDDIYCQEDTTIWLRPTPDYKLSNQDKLFLKNFMDKYDTYPIDSIVLNGLKVVEDINSRTPLKREILLFIFEKIKYKVNLSGESISRILENVLLYGGPLPSWELVERDSPRYYPVINGILSLSEDLREDFADYFLFNKYLFDCNFFRKKSLNNEDYLNSILIEQMSYWFKNRLYILEFLRENVKNECYVGNISMLLKSIDGLYNGE